MNKKTQQKLLTTVKKNYNQIASLFSKTRQKVIWPEVASLAKQVKNGSNILDVGCGNGRLLELFKNKKINYLGVDNSEGLIKLAQKKFPKDKSKFKVYNILELDKLKQSNFDYIFCIAVLHHIPGQDLQVNALEQLKNKLGKNGKIVLTVWNLWTKKKYCKLIFKFALLKLIGKNKMAFGDILFSWKNNKRQNLSERYYHAFTKCGLKKIVKKSGLNLEKIYKDKYNYYLVITAPNNSVISTKGRNL